MISSVASPYACAALIREIGRGARGARGLTREQAYELYAAMLAGRVSDLELGAVLLSYRIKGEDVQELAGMLQAVHAATPLLPSPAGTPVCIPSYNGARKKPNLLPLLATLLAREGVPVLIHGVMNDAGRVTSAEILAEMGVRPCANTAAVGAGLAQARLAFAPIDMLAPALSRQLDLRRILGVRNSAHTLVKMLQPFAGPALRLINYTHPAYRDTLAQYFKLPGAAGPAGILLSQGTEGEAVADAALAREVLWIREEHEEQLIAASEKAQRDTPTLPASIGARDTARWTEGVLAGKHPAPASVLAQVRIIKQVAQIPAA
jgi:anthranilate phosphoribosyltransferase